MDVCRFISVDRPVQLEGAVGEGALEDAHLPQPAVKISGEAIKVW